MAFFGTCPSNGMAMKQLNLTKQLKAIVNASNNSSLIFIYPWICNKYKEKQKIIYTEHLWFYLPLLITSSLFYS